jgi:hypothetical protein
MIASEIRGQQTRQINKDKQMQDLDDDEDERESQSNWFD